ncbi:MAG: ATP-binding protein [Bacteroidales bacterium]
MEPETIIKYAIFTITSIIALTIILILTFRFWKKKPDELIKAPNSLVELIENMIDIYFNSVNTKEQISLLKTIYTKEGNLELKGLIDKFENYSNNRDSQTLGSLLGFLEKNKKLDFNLDYYISFYKNILTLSQFNNNNKYIKYLKGKEKLEIPIVFTNINDIKPVARRVLFEMLLIIDILYKTADFLIKLLDDKLVESLIEIDNLRSLLNDKLDIVESAKKYYPNETPIIFESIIAIIYALDEKRKEALIEKTGEFPISLVKENYLIIKQEEFPIEIEFKNNTDSLIEDITFKIDVLSDSYQINQSFGRIPSLNFNASQSFEFFIKLIYNLNEIDLPIEISYRKHNGKLANKTNIIKIKFENKELLSATAPYSTSPKVGKIDTFVGREVEKSKIIRALCSDNSGQVIGLFGLARVGKTALLFELINDEKLIKRIIFVYISLDSISEKANTWMNIFLEILNNELIKQISHAGLHLPKEKKKYDNTANKISIFLEDIQQELKHHNKYIVIIIDEYQRLEELTHSALEHQKHDILRLFKQIAINIPRIDLIVSGYHDISILAKQDKYWSEYLGKGFLSLKLQFLTVTESLRLIKEPMLRFGINYEEGIPKKIYDLTVGYPWYINLVCFRLFENIQTELKKTINGVHLDKVIKEIIDSDSTYFDHIFSGKWAGTIMEAIICIIANANQKNIHLKNNLYFVNRDYILGQFHRFGCKIEMGQLAMKLESLEKKDIIVIEKNKENIYIAIRIPLLEMWNKNKADVESIIARI